MEIFAFESIGFDGEMVRVEADIRRGIPAVDIVGLAAASIREARERIRAAIRNAGFEFPQDRVLINLSPADLPKEGTLYDLPIAAKILQVTDQIPDCGKNVFIGGELTLDGHVSPVRGIIPALLRSLKENIRFFIVPCGNSSEVASLKEGCSYSISHISQLSNALIAIRNGKKEIPGENGDTALLQSFQNATRDDQSSNEPDFSDYFGNPSVIRAMTIAASGGHNVLLFGPPGSGKTMAAQRFASLLPDLGETDALEVSALWSLHGGNYARRNSLRPPVRTPHHTASLEGMVGGGTSPRPGEISLAHKGVLFLDETPEFRKDVLQSLREPLETGSVTIVRAGRVLRYPADFQLVMAANPCPCGNLGNPAKNCVCSPIEVQRYWKKLGGPLLDRIDMRIPIHVPNPALITDSRKNDQQAFLVKVNQAVERQRSRYGKGHVKRNSRLDPAEIISFCVLDSRAARLFRQKSEELGLSARACHSVLKIARTIADMEEVEIISENIMAEAVGFRQFGDGDSFWPY